MSYKISYGETAKMKMRKPNIRFVVPVAAVLAAALGVTARLCWPDETKQLIEALFPLTSDSSQQALKSFSENIRAGEPIGDAVTAFCREIIYESEIS